MRLWLAVLALLMPLSAKAENMTASHPWIRYLLPGIPASGYMVLRNDGATDEALTGAKSPACGSLMLHESQNDSGMAMMTDIPSLTVPAHGSVSLAPGGYHLMCMQPVMRVGGKVALSLMFKSGARLQVTAPVYGALSAP